MYLYMMVHPGKKLNFMGSEIGQLREWDEKREQDWMLRKFPAHDSFYHYMQELNHLYLSHSALWEWDYQEGGFQWLDCHQEGRCIYAIERRSSGERLAALFNFGSKKQSGYTVALPNATGVVPLLYSDWEPFGGITPVAEMVCSLKEDQLICTLQPFSAILLGVREEVPPARQ